MTISELNRKNQTWRSFHETAPAPLKEVITRIEETMFQINPRSNGITHVQFGHKGCRITLGFGSGITKELIQHIEAQNLTYRIEATESCPGCLPVSQIVLFMP